MSFLPQGSNPHTAGFTCNTCAVRFVTAELQRQHMRTDWHRYNLKRRVAQLPSISSDVFAEKVLAAQEEEVSNDEDEFGFPVTHRKVKGERQLTKKEIRQQARWAARGRSDLFEDGALERTASPASVASTYSEFSLGDSEHYSDFDTGSEFNYSDGTADLASNDSEEGTDVSSDEEVDEGPLEILPNHYCFYCGKNNEEIEQNIRHMTHAHGLYVPERSYLVNLDGLLTFVNEVITIDNECLTCGFQGRSLESVRQHMISKGHCRIPYESKEERLTIAEFYNFKVAEPTKSLSSKKVSFQAPSKSGAESSPVDVRLREEDGYTIVDTENSPDSMELTLPSGTRVGHRAMARYHRQSLPGPRELDESTKTVALVDRRFAPGLTTTEVTKQEKQAQRIENKARNTYERRTNTKRVNNQEHFRDVLLGVL